VPENLIRRLTSLYQTSDHSGLWYVSFAYYKRDEFGHLEWTGESESCTLTTDELYDLIKPKLVKERK
jgi:hypothetical protein